MPTFYRGFPDIAFRGVIDGRLVKYDVIVEEEEEFLGTKRYLVGPAGSVEVYCHDDLTSGFLIRGHFPPTVYTALVEEFAVELVSEHDFRFWGFDSEAEWDAAKKKTAKER
jgi:hypothetical protein